MKNSTLKEIDKWMRDNNILAKKKHIPLLECYRRINSFHYGNLNSNLQMLALPSEIKPVSRYFYPVSQEIPRVYNWYNLTDEGKKVIGDLRNRIVWNQKEMGLYILNMTL
ncbi:MAG: hypothetical protein ACOC2U_04480 [bacterium]